MTSQASAVAPSARPSRSRHLLRFAACGVAASLALAAQPTAAFAAPPSVTGPSEPVAYVEQAPPVSVGEQVSFAGGSAYGGGYLDFAVDGGTADETLSLLTAETADTTAGVVSIVGTSVYLGNGTAADLIGAVASDRAGANGALRIVFASPFDNPSFEDDDSIGGWTVIEDRVDLGVTTIAGVRSIDQSTYAGISGGSGFSAPVDDNAAPTRATYTVRLSTVDASHGATSLELTSDMQTAEGCDVVHGPAVYSNPFEAAANDKISFDWRAFQGSDNFHVYGYILNTVTGAQTPVLDATGGNEVNAFVTKETVIPASGEYRFVFVGGTQDKTCGRAAGATLLIDNVRVFGTKVTDAVAASISDKLQYHNASDDPAATRTISITAADADGQVSAAGTVAIAITAVDDAPAFGPVAPITLLNQDGAQSYPTSTGTLDATDPDSPITSAIVGGEQVTTTIDGVTYTQRKAGTYGTLYLDGATGAYAFVPDAAAADARQRDDSESFEFEISAEDRSPGGPHPAKTARQSLTVSLQVSASGPGAGTATSAVAGVERAFVSWTAPAWEGGAAITGYAVEWSIDAGGSWTTAIADTGSDATSATVLDLTAGTPLVFRVAGINANGQGPWATVSNEVTPYTKPAAPTPITATPGDTTVELGWTAPVADGWSPVTGYRIEQSIDGGRTWATLVADTGTPLPMLLRGQALRPSALLAPTPATNYTVSGLRNGEPVAFRVSAINAAGTGVHAETALTTPRTTPGAPAPLVATPDDARVALSWSAPADTGGAPITGYRVEQSTDGGKTWTTLIADTGSTATSTTVTGLANGTPVAFRVSALNEAGSGPAADASATPRRPADAVTVDSITPGNRTLTVAFTPPADDGGSPISGYEYSIDGGKTWIPAKGTTSPIVIEGLGNGVPRSVSVRAVTDAGPGEASPVQTATPVLQPIRSSSGALPKLAAGKAASTLSGVDEPVSTSTDGDEFVISGDGFEVRVQAVGPDGKPVALVNGALAVPAGGSLRISGDGFQGGSVLDFWLLGAELGLGEATANADGSFTATLTLPEGLRLGAETLQINGLAPDGSVRSIVTGITVVSADDLATTGRDVSMATVALTGGGALLLLLAGIWISVITRRRRGEGRAQL
ncbi:fibronectin type III domain-containing protein [Agromyces soli]|uniref:Fibronectin type III domain-containing protein n=1 Tax=Agromyces soli TaxID=659012 RepID=A0ABY4AWI3_9MICO|nr:fibronectin type III domain-containing protein [Agromyces soli]UOE27548.1 fibronectin type III domain-containing protein [Agromyces soli]